MVPGVARGVLRVSLVSFGDPWGIFRSPWGVLGRAWGVIGEALGVPRGPTEGLGEPLGFLLELI